MIKYISILRGINVSGHKKIKMDSLKTVYASCGFEDITTYIQSGNVLFHATKKSKNHIKSTLENAIKKHYGFHIPINIHTHEEMKSRSHNEKLEDSEETM